MTTVLGQNDPDCDLFALRRIVIASDDDLPTFAARASGLTSWYNRVAGLFMERSQDEPELTPGTPTASHTRVTSQLLSNDKNFRKNPEPFHFRLSQVVSHWR